MLAIKDWLAIIGISSLIATGVGHWLAKGREHEHWAYENRKQEWRELIDQLHVILHRMSFFHSRLREEILDDVSEGMRILTSRLFISGTLEEHQINKKWGGLIANLFSTSESEKVDHNEFSRRLFAFEDELISVAQNDLKFKRVKRIW